MDLNKTKMAQVHAGEQAVMENLRDMGLLPDHKPETGSSKAYVLVKKLYRNIKTNGLYYAFGIGVNTTNAQNGETLILYMRVENKELMSDKIFCREHGQFLQKFKPSTDL